MSNFEGILHQADLQFVELAVGAAKIKEFPTAQRVEPLKYTLKTF